MTSLTTLRHATSHIIPPRFLSLHTMHVFLHVPTTMHNVPFTFRRQSYGHKISALGDLFRWSYSKDGG
jgi:hypothetical protein